MAMFGQVTQPTAQVNRFDRNMIQEGWNYAKNFQTVYIAPVCEVIKGGLHQYCCFSVRKEQEKVLATAHQQSRMEREEGQVRVVPYLT